MPRRSTWWLIALLVLGATVPALGQATSREALAQAEALFAQGHLFTDEELHSLDDLEANLRAEGETDLAADAALLRAGASVWFQAREEDEGSLEDRSSDWELRDRRQRERDFWLGVRNFGLTTFVLSSTSTLVLAWTLDRNEALLNNGAWVDYRNRDATMNRLGWAMGASAATAFLSLFPLLWGEARQ